MFCCSFFPLSLERNDKVGCWNFGWTNTNTNENACLPHARVCATSMHRTRARKSLIEIGLISTNTNVKIEFNRRELLQKFRWNWNAEMCFVEYSTKFNFVFIKNPCAFRWCVMRACVCVFIWNFDNGRNSAELRSAITSSLSIEMCKACSCECVCVDSVKWIHACAKLIENSINQTFNRCTNEWTKTK